MGLFYDDISQIRGPVSVGAPFSCDLSLFKRFGNMPAVLLGPRGDNLHAPDEWVEIEDILALTRVFANLALRWCGYPTERT